MSRIQQLSSHVVNKIAAGEVIERPASVVKELLENSVDALATRIEVDIEEGGTQLIRVTDDGEGIEPEDLPLAVASHATSKLREAEDLFRVLTLGFRGEALASIAEVSRLRIRSRTPERPTGAELEVALGAPGGIKPCGCPTGTSIEVRDLFANTPVRRKFLKSASTEFGHISEQFTRVALVNPRLHMVLRHNGKTVYELPATGQQLDRISLFFGGDLARHLITVESELDGVRLWGFVAHPSQSKATRKGQYLFLNGRWIQDRSLQHALGEAYRGLLMVGRNPVTFLFLEMPAELVDVNVHPTKAEVRFRESQKLYRQLLSTIRTKFLALDLNSELTVRAGGGAGAGSMGLTWQPYRAERSESGFGAGGPIGHQPQPSFGDRSQRGFGDRPQREWPAVDPEKQKQAQEDFAAWVKDQTNAWGTPGYEPAWTDPIPETEDEPRESEGRKDLGSSNGSEIEPKDQHFPPGAGSMVEDPAAGPNSSLPAGTDVRAMQIHDAYLVVETEQGLTVVDQHALHERILYEQFRNRVLSGTVESQRLLVPQPVELSAAEAAILKDHAELLSRFGLKVEEFGGNTMVVAAYPVMLRRTEPARLVKDVADQLTETGADPSRRDLLDSLLHMMACKAAIKAGQRLTPEEIESLLAQRHLIDDAHHCPHGRPTALVLSREELDRQFGRLG